MEGTTLFEIAIDRASRAPLNLQVYDALRRAIADGRLSRGARLPSTRALAKRLKVSRNTVLNAYETLLSEGLVISRIGSGTRVRALHGIPAPAALQAAALLHRAHFPIDPSAFEDPDGNLLYAHR
jgi:GntR family transcriptional regulator / MocR family aminotransferase